MRTIGYRRRLGLLAAMVAVLAMLAACGKAGRLELPEGEEDQFPHQYPSPDEI